MIDYDEFQAEVRRLKRERWAKMLAAEPPGRPAGRRPRDPEQERMLQRMDRARLERENPDLLRRGPQRDEPRTEASARAGTSVATPRRRPGTP